LERSESLLISIGLRNVVLRSFLDPDYGEHLVPGGKPGLPAKDYIPKAVEKRFVSIGWARIPSVDGKSKDEVKNSGDGSITFKLRLI